MKYFGSPLCPDCVEASRLLAEAGKTLEMTDITASMMNLKEFLALRDRREEFAPVREGGWSAFRASCGTTIPSPLT